MYSYGEGFPFLREAFLFGNSLYIWGMEKETATETTLNEASFHDSLRGKLDMLLSFERKYEIVHPEHGVITSELIPTAHSSSKAWWDNVHVMD